VGIAQLLTKRELDVKKIIRSRQHQQGCSQTRH
jgi:hypothetical protein